MTQKTETALQHKEAVAWKGFFAILRYVRVIKSKELNILVMAWIGWDSEIGVVAFIQQAYE
jgi:hypothetical protein